MQLPIPMGIPRLFLFLWGQGPIPEDFLRELLWGHSYGDRDPNSILRVKSRRDRVPTRITG